MEFLLRDLRRSWRRLWQQPTPTLVALVTLALAIGAASAMFSVFSALLLRQLPFAQPDRLVWLTPASLRTGQPQLVTSGVSQPDFLDYRAGNHSFSSLVGYYVNPATLVDAGPPQHVNWAGVTAGFFAALGAQPALGRGILPSDESPPNPQVAVLSDHLWRQRYRSDPLIVGKTLDLDNNLFTIVGVMPPGFAYPPKVDFWAPMTFNPATIQLRSARWMHVLGRLRPGVTPASAQRDLNAIAARLAERYPDSNADQGIVLTSLALVITGPFRTTLGMMMLAAIVVLAIACANVANLLLAGAATRWREIALRVALGARRRQLLAQLLLEGVVLAGLGGILGWLLAFAAMPALRRLQAPGLPSLAQVSLDYRVLGFTLAATMATALWFGLAPAWELLRPGAGRSLHRDTGNGTESTRTRFLTLVAAGEVAATVVLLVMAAMMLQNLRRVLRTQPGFDPHGVLTFRVSLLFDTMAQLRQQMVYLQRLNQAMQAMPGVEAAGMISELPLNGRHLTLRFIVVGGAGSDALRVVDRPQASVAHVLPGYFQAMRIPVQGRVFTDADNASGEHVVIVSAALARHFFPSGDALQHSLRWGIHTISTARIVGVAADVKQDSLSQPPEWVIYLPFLQDPSGDLSAAVRARGDPMALLPQMRRAMAAINPQMPLYDVATMDELVAQAQAPDRFRAGLLAGMGLLALLLALAGVYGVLAHSVALRQRELGVRMALGAGPRQVEGMILRQSLRLLLGGAAVGLALAAGLVVLARHAAAGLPPPDPLAFGIAPLLLVATGLLASFWPARLATRVDPVRILREP